MEGQAPSAQREMHPDALEIMQDLNKESKRIARYRARMESVDKWMGKRHLPKSLRTRIGHHYQEVSFHVSCNASFNTPKPGSLPHHHFSQNFLSDPCCLQ